MNRTIFVIPAILILTGCEVFNGTTVVGLNSPTRASVIGKELYRKEINSQIALHKEEFVKCLSEIKIRKTWGKIQYAYTIKNCNEFANAHVALRIARKTTDVQNRNSNKKEATP
jgi:hypothetical protein